MHKKDTNDLCKVPCLYKIKDNSGGGIAKSGMTGMGFWRLVGWEIER